MGFRDNDSTVMHLYGLTNAQFFLHNTTNEILANEIMHIFSNIDSQRVTWDTKIDHL